VDNIRILEVYKNYFWDFYAKLPQQVREKFDYVFNIMVTVEKVPIKFFKHLEDGIYEIRIERDSNIYRIFSFFDEGRLVILLHGVQKKRQKTARKEIEKAKKLRQDYYNEKRKTKNDQ